MNPKIDEIGPNFSSGRTSRGSVVAGFLENHDMLEKALDGLAKCLQDVNSDITKITTTDIIAASKLPPHTVEYYYSDPYKIISDIHSSIKGIISSVVKDCEEKKLSTDEGIDLLLERLKKQPKMLDVICLSSDYLIWKLNLKDFCKKYATGWKEYDDLHWNFLYLSFCFLFMMVVKKWRAYEFNSDCLPICIKLIKELLTTNVIFTDMVANWTH